MLSDFETRTVPHQGIKHTVYTKGKGPGIVLIHELPGMTKECIALARRLVDAGYAVYMPLLFGKPGKEAVKTNLLRVCISREFYCFAANKTSPIVEWLKEVCRVAHEECGGPGVGAIGMCLTGNFTIALMADPHMLAPVSCQPSLPFPLGETRASALALDEKDLAKAKKRAEEGQPLLCFRFSGDATSPKARFEKLREVFGPAFQGMEIDSSAGNPFKIRPRAHSVLTGDFIDSTGHPTREAYDRVLTFFEDRLVV